MDDDTTAPFGFPAIGRKRLTTAYWLMLAWRDRILRPHPLTAAEFATLRLHLLTIAGRIIETANRERVALVAACPHAMLVHGLARSLLPAGP